MPFLKNTMPSLKLIYLFKLALLMLQPKGVSGKLMVLLKSPAVALTLNLLVK
jgi:hypothetical protein